MKGEIGLSLLRFVHLLAGLAGLVGLGDIPESGLEVDLDCLPESGLEDLPESGLEGGLAKSNLNGTGPICIWRMAS